MHNKVIVADNALAIIGGRNIGDHYFSVSKKGNFRDLDVICAGPVVRDISDVHDYFWNAPWAVPVRTLAGNGYSLKHLQKSREKLAQKARKYPFPYRMDRSRSGMTSELTNLRSRMIWAHGIYVWNDPKELIRNKEHQKNTIIHKLDQKASNIRRRMLVESPYFIPKNDGVASFKTLVDRNVQVRILTNSMRSNDVLPSHAGYARYREDLVRAGVELYELRPDAKEGRKKSKFSFSGSQNAGLHTKAFVFDQDSVFVGSFNLDPRSSSINTEGGLYVESHQLAKELIDYMDADILPCNSYRVMLDAQGRLEWITEIDGKQVTYHRDPESGLWSRFLVRLMQMLPIEDQL
jgi:putative cardiolipin synthase